MYTIRRMADHTVIDCDITHELLTDYAYGDTVSIDCRQYTTTTLSMATQWTVEVFDELMSSDY